MLAILLNHVGKFNAQIPPSKEYFEGAYDAGVELDKMVSELQGTSQTVARSLLDRFSYGTEGRDVAVDAAMTRSEEDRKRRVKADAEAFQALLAFATMSVAAPAGAAPAKSQGADSSSTSAFVREAVSRLLAIYALMEKWWVGPDWVVPPRDTPEYKLFVDFLSLATTNNRRTFTTVERELELPALLLAIHRFPLFRDFHIDLVYSMEPGVKFMANMVAKDGHRALATYVKQFMSAYAVILWCLEDALPPSKLPEFPISIALAFAGSLEAALSKQVLNEALLRYPWVELVASIEPEGSLEEFERLYPRSMSRWKQRHEPVVRLGSYGDAARGGSGSGSPALHRITDSSSPDRSTKRYEDRSKRPQDRKRQERVCAYCQSVDAPNYKSHSTRECYTLGIQLKQKAGPTEGAKKYIDELKKAGLRMPKPPFTWKE